MISIAAGVAADSAGNLSIIAESSPYSVEDDVEATWSAFKAGDVSIDGGDAYNTLTITETPLGTSDGNFSDDELALQNISGVEALHFNMAVGEDVSFTFSERTQTSGVQDIVISGSDYSSAYVAVRGYGAAIVDDGGLSITTDAGR